MQHDARRDNFLEKPLAANEASWRHVRQAQRAARAPCAISSQSEASLRSAPSVTAVTVRLHVQWWAPNKGSALLNLLINDQNSTGRVLNHTHHQAQRASLTLGHTRRARTRIRHRCQFLRVYPPPRGTLGGGGSWTARGSGQGFRDRRTETEMYRDGDGDGQRQRWTETEMDGDGDGQRRRWTETETDRCLWH